MRRIGGTLRHTVRSLAKDPSFTATAVLTLGLGVGANFLVSIAIDAALVRPLPFVNAGQLVALRNVYQPPPAGAVMRWLDFRDWQRVTELFEALGGFSTGGMNLSGDGEAARARVTLVTEGFFEALGTSPMAGRLFSAEDFQSGVAATVVLSQGVWRRQFGADPHVLGRVIRLNSRPFVVVGIISHDQSFPGGTDLWLPYQIPWGPWVAEIFRNSRTFQVVARLQEGVSPEQARERMRAIGRAFRQEHPAPVRIEEPEVVSLRAELLEGSEANLSFLFAASALMLVITCANVAGLLLERLLRRQHEIAIRLAIGAGRWRLTRLLLAESATLAFAGAVLGLLVAWLGKGTLAELIPQPMTTVAPIEINGHVLVLGIGLTAVAAVLFGLPPAFLACSLDVADWLKMGMYGLLSRRAAQVWSTLVVAQTSFTLVLVLGAGLLLRSLGELWRVDPGFQPDNILTFSIVMPRARYPSGEAAASFVDRVLGTLRLLPGVYAAGGVSVLPLAPEGGLAAWPFSIPGKELGNSADSLQRAEVVASTPDYFRVLRIPLLRGRTFSVTDQSTHAPMIVVSKSFADRYWPMQDPLGGHVALPGAPSPYVIVGVVGDVRSRSLDSPPRQAAGQLYLLYEQRPATYITFVLRTTISPSAVTGQVRSLLSRLDPEVPIYGIRTMEDVIGISIAPRRPAVYLLGFAGALALTLTGVGLYGLLAQHVSARMREMGIRLALGAVPSDLMATAAIRGIRLVAIGLVLGGGLFWPASLVLRGLLYGVQPWDPYVVGTAAAFLGCTALVASYLPARRAAMADPAGSLRAE